MRYRVLGPVTVIGRGGPVRPGGPKQAALLAVLLLNANRVVAESRMIELVWGDRPPPSVRGRIQVSVSQLRKLVGRDVISRGPSGYVIEVAPGELDLDIFDQTVARARCGGPDAIEQLRYALSLWDGPALAGVTEALAASAGPALAERRLAVLDELYELELAAGRHVETVGELWDAVEQHPVVRAITRPPDARPAPVRPHARGLAGLRRDPDPAGRRTRNRPGTAVAGPADAHPDRPGRSRHPAQGAVKAPARGTAVGCQGIRRPRGRTGHTGLRTRRDLGDQRNGRGRQDRVGSPLGAHRPRALPGRPVAREPARF